MGIGYLITALNNKNIAQMRFVASRMRRRKMSPIRCIFQFTISQFARCRLGHNTSTDIDDHRDHLGQEAEHNTECKGTVIQCESSLL